MIATGQATKKNHLVTEQLEPNASRFQNFKLMATISIIVLLFASVFGMVSGIVFDDYQFLLALQVFIELLILFTFQLALIFMVLWFARAYTNLHALGWEGLRFKDYWGFLGWYVPIFSVFMPFRVMRDILVGYDQLSANEEVKSGSTTLKLSIIWWGLYLAPPLLSSLSLLLVAIEPTATQFLLLAFYKLLMMVFWIIGIFLIEYVHDREERVYQVHATVA